MIQTRTFTLKKKLEKFFTKKSKLENWFSFFYVPELSKKNPIVQGDRIFTWILQEIANNNFNNFDNRINHFGTLTFVSDSFWIVFGDITKIFKK